MDRYLSTHKKKLTLNQIKIKKRTVQTFLYIFLKSTTLPKEYKAKTMSMSMKHNIWVVKNLQSESSAWGHGIKV
jgi:hypothetical protein